MEQFMQVVTYLRGLNMASLLIRFALAIVCGGLIGADRGKKNQAAGLRTHLLICIGAASAMIVNQYISTFLSPGADMSRMGAQVISGVGFVAVGTIIVKGVDHHVKGLTTAAGLWASACMGLVIGIGYYEGAIVMCAALLLVLQAVNNVDKRYIKLNKTNVVYLEYSEEFRVSLMIKAIRNQGYSLSGVEYISNNKVGGGAMQLTIRKTSKEVENISLIESIQDIEGILFIEEF